MGPTPELPDDDPFRIGWRFVKRPDGTVEQVPLAQDDLLRPEEDDFHVKSQIDTAICFYLHMVFSHKTSHLPEALVLMRHRIVWRLPEEGAPEGALGPDLLVIMKGASDHDPHLGTFEVTAERRPHTAVEVATIDTLENDYHVKLEEYARAGVAQYLIIDPTLPDRVTARLYALGPNGYVARPPDERGRLWLEGLGVWLEAREDGVVCHDGETQEKFGTYMETMESIAEMRGSLRDLNEAQQNAERALEELERALEKSNRANAERDLCLERLRKAEDPT